MLERRRLSFAERHEQLLDAAETIACQEGADALTLARTAKMAGVSKPIAYDHFGSREGILKALYTRIADGQLSLLSLSLERETASLDEAVESLVESYINCALHAGRKFGTVIAALETIPNAEAFLRDSRARHAEIYQQTINRFANKVTEDQTAVTIGVMGAADAIARGIIEGALTQNEATAALKQIIRGVVES